MATPAELEAEGKCYACYGATPAEQIELALLARWLVRLDPTADTDPDTIAESARCFCGATRGVDLLRLGFLREISAATNPAATTNPDVLLFNASCFQCYGASIADQYELALLAQIADG